MELRKYQKSEANEIIELFKRVFSDSEGESEGLVISELVENIFKSTDEKDLFGFVSRTEDKITGCILFSRLTFETPIEAFMLSPVAVDTEHQGQGIGQKLINYGINELRSKGVELVFTYGDPNFYSKTGFKSISQEQIKSPYPLSHPEGWLGQSIQGNQIEIPEKPSCVKAFDNPHYW